MSAIQRGFETKGFQIDDIRPLFVLLFSKLKLDFPAPVFTSCATLDEEREAALLDGEEAAKTKQPTVRARRKRKPSGELVDGRYFNERTKVLQFEAGEDLQGHIRKLYCKHPEMLVEMLENSMVVAALKKHKSLLKRVLTDDGLAAEEALYLKIELDLSHVQYAVMRRTVPCMPPLKHVLAAMDLY